MGAKVLNTYRGFSASDINTRASNTCTHSVVGSTVECTNVMLSKVKTVLGASDNSLYNLCRHANVNHYSGFGPTVITESHSGNLDSTLVFSDPTTASLGSFAGYNHSAPSPAWSGSNPNGRTTNVTSGNQADLYADYTLGEVQYPGVDLVVTYWENSNLTSFLGYARVAQSGLTTSVNLDWTTTYSGGITTDKTIYGALFFCDDTSSSFQSNGSQVRGMAPNTTSWSETLHVYTGEVTFTNKGNWGIVPYNTAVSYYVDASTGLLTITSILNSVDPDDSNLMISISISGPGVTDGSHVVFQSSIDGTYYTNTTLGPITHHCSGGNPVDIGDWVINISWGTEI